MADNTAVTILDSVIIVVENDSVAHLNLMGRMRQPALCGAKAFESKGLYFLYKGEVCPDCKAKVTRPSLPSDHDT